MCLPTAHITADVGHIELTYIPFLIKINCSLFTSVSFISTCAATILRAPV